MDLYYVQDYYPIEVKFLSPWQNSTYMYLPILLSVNIAQKFALGVVGVIFSHKTMNKVFFKVASIQFIPVKIHDISTKMFAGSIGLNVLWSTVTMRNLACICVRI